MLSTRTLLTLLAGSAVLLSVLVAGAGGSAGERTGQTVTIGGPTTEEVPDTHDGAVGSEWPTVPGEVTTEPVVTDERILVGTDRGLAVFSADGELQHHVETQPVRRVTATADGTATVLVDNEYFPSVKQVDVDSGEVAWEAGHSVEVYSSDFGAVRRQARPSDATPVGDGTADVAVSVGQSVVLYDGASGDVVWEHDHDFNVWEVDAAGGTVYAGTQDGQVLALNAESGDVEFETQVVEPFDLERDDAGTPHRSVWTVEQVTVGGADRVVVTGEDGTAHLLDAADGSTVWSQQVVEYDDQVRNEYYGRLLGQGRLTIPGDATFSAVEATIVERGDSVDVAVAVTPEQYPPRVGLENTRRSLHLLDGASGQPQWSSSDVDLTGTGSVALSPAENAIVVPQGPSDRTQRVTLVDIESGETETRTFDAIPPRDRAVEGAATAYATTAGNWLALATTTGDLRVGSVDGTVDWSYPAFRNVDVRSRDFTGDGVEDYLFASADAGERTAGPPQSRGLVLRDGSDGSLAWSALLDAEEFNRGGGYATLQTVTDRDDGADLLAVRYPPRDRQEAANTSVVLFDGQSGETEFELHFDWLRSATAVGDVRGNGNADIFFAADGFVVLADMREGREYWARSYQNNPEQDVEVWRPFDGERPTRYLSVGDGDDDGIDEMVTFSRQGTVATVSIDPDQSIETVQQTSLGSGIQPPQPRAVGDLTGDGYEEVLFRTEGDDGPVLAVYAPGQGTVVERIEQVRADDLRRVDGDFTGDGSPGAVVAQTRSDAPSVTVYTGMQQVLRHNFDQKANVRIAGVESVSPAAPAGDVDDDGADEIALVETSSEGGARVNLTDAGSGEVVDSIELERFERENARTAPGVYAQSIPDRTGDDSPELGIVVDVGGHESVDLRYYVVDPQAGEVLLSGEGRAVEFIPAGESGVGVVSPDGSVTPVNPTAGVRLTETDGDSELDLTWEFDDDESHVTRVYVDGWPVTLTTDGEATVRLPPGEHTVQVRATGADGVTVYDTTTVEVEEGSSLDLLLYGLTLAALALLLVPYLLRRYRRRQ